MLQQVDCDGGKTIINGTDFVSMPFFLSIHNQVSYSLFNSFGLVLLSRM